MMTETVGLLRRPAMRRPRELRMPHQILHLLGTAQPAGTSFNRIVGSLARGLDADRYTIHAWFLGEEGPLAAELERTGARVRMLEWHGMRRDPLGAWKLWRAVHREGFAVIHQHCGGASVRWIARQASHAKVLLHIHGPEMESQGPEPVPRRVWGTDAVIATSRATAAVALGVRPNVVYPGVPVPGADRRFAGSRPHANPVVGTARRLVTVKGVVFLIRAVAALRAEFPEIRLEVAGTGPERVNLENEARLLNASDCVSFLGWQDDIDSLLARWDIFVMPSLQEGFGIAALEAMAAGLPVVATTVGGVPELVDDGQTGWLVPPGDSAALAHRLRELLLDPDQRRVMGAAGQARARQHFSTNRMVSDISKIYDRLLAGSGD
jgi:glycosyltransferase involved in cell wall biosynthesis